ncbi:type IV conjugative transfer system coupling protein TraD [Pseudohalioglobus lutimaris]|uniref:Conjugative coupling factor TraD, PFGI-1 class n=1 Tax=Pseudohalioglobus lutimaris TaxID=1737061 RepID=A0A2N5WZW7_9GAMM|nr:type IV conjugative transfer system coupling protein TraD [Pseudohalioglobus lutimaris]PLW67777.1 conjugative coupling factor TraD, PFGI-1 class [Pseudohalioglobus lutimaris]
MSNQPIEALLRPPVELSSVVTNTAMGIVAISAPQVLMMPGGVGYTVGALCLARALWLASHCVKLKKYQRRLHVLPSYEINPARIKKDEEELFLGKGFEWTAKHTQRRADLERPEYAHFHHIGPVQSTARRLIDGIGNALGRWSVAPLNTQSLLNPFPPRPYVEGNAALHAVGLYEKERKIHVRQSERVAHTFVVGTTRVGKTRLLEVIATQDIRNGNVVIVFDPKGDGDLLARLYTEAKRAGREGQFQVFHLGFPEQSVSYNPVGSYSRITEVATRIAGQLPNEGNSAAFREFAWRYVNVIAKALDDMSEPINYQNLLDSGSDIDGLLTRYLAYVADLESIDGWEQRVEAFVSSDAKLPPQLKGRDRTAWASVECYRDSELDSQTANSLIKTFEHDKSHFDKLVASLFPLLEKLTSGPAAQLLSPSDEELSANNRLNWGQVIKRGGIVYVGLDALSDPDVASAVGNAMFADLTSVAGSLYKERQSGGSAPRISVHADEFNELVGREFVPLANKAGGAGFQLTAYTQTLSDIVARFDSQARAGQVVGNLGTLIMLRVKERATAELLTTRLKDVEINHLMLESGTTDSSNPETDIHFVSNTRQRITSQRVPMIHTGDLDALPKGHAFALLAGRLYKLRLPLFDDDKDLPTGLQSMVDSMKGDYVSANNQDWAQTSPIAPWEVA